MSQLKFPPIDQASQVFGKAAQFYGKLINGIAPKLFSETYVFEDNATYEQKSLHPEEGRAYSGQIYWREILFRAHMASVASIVRTTRWAEVATREYAATNLLGWAAACRSLIEASGDSGHSLARIPLDLAINHRNILVEVSGRASGPAIISGDTENSLIHFMHARKIGRTENSSTESHRARQPWEYIKFIEDMKIDGVKEFYSELCERVHPAADSLTHMFTLQGDKWSFRLENEQYLLDEILVRRRELLSNILMAAYNPPILILRVLHKFEMFTQLDALRKYRFDAIPLWQKIDAALK